MDIVVIRGAGDLPGEDIIEPILATDAAGVQRGAAEINERSTNKSTRIVTLPARTGLLMGRLYRVINAITGTEFIGKLTAIDHAVQVDPIEATSTLTFKVPE